MKNIIILFYLLFFNYTLFAQDDKYELIYYSKIHFSLFHDVGQKHYFYQHCLTDIDSLISNGSITHTNTSIGNLEKCKYSIVIEDTTISSITISTNRKKHTKKLYKITNSILPDFRIVESFPNSYYIFDIISLNKKKCYLLFIAGHKNKFGYLKIQKM